MQAVEEAGGRTGGGEKGTRVQLSAAESDEVETGTAGGKCCKLKRSQEERSAERQDWAGAGGFTRTFTGGECSSSRRFAKIFLASIVFYPPGGSGVFANQDAAVFQMDFIIQRDRQNDGIPIAKPE